MCSISTRYEIARTNPNILAFGLCDGNSSLTKQKQRTAVRRFPVESVEIANF